MAILNKQQEEAKAKIHHWFKHETLEKQTFTLSGYAGTGKTFLINYVIYEVLKLSKDETAFVTPTGKAASVLIQRGCDAMTIHRLIYTPVEVEYETELNGKKVKSKRMEFKKKSEIKKYKLIIVDEVSMIEEKIMNDLLSFGIPVLCSGDPGQLPSIFKSNDLLEHPDYLLTEIVRQAKDNAITQVANMAREKKPLPYGKYKNDVVITSRERLSDEQFKNILLKSDQIICGKNSTRNYLNNLVREYKGIDVINNKYPLDGEKVICTVNNWEIFLDELEEFNLVNGTMGIIKNFKIIDDKINLSSFDFKADFLDEYKDNILHDSGIFDNLEFSYDMHQMVYKIDDDKYILKEKSLLRKENESLEDYKNRVIERILAIRKATDELQVNRFEYGYAISCHKSQGSEFDVVTVFDESDVFLDKSAKWLYTAITRAKKKLIIIK